MSYPYIKCPECFGDGSDDEDSSKDCYYCHGGGVVKAECVAGCKVYTGDEVYHHKDCPHYAESMSRMLDETKQLLKEIIDCPHSVDLATVPKAGIEKKPEQVVLNYSISYARIKMIQKILGNK